MDNISIQIGDKFKLLDDIICFDIGDIFANNAKHEAFDNKLNTILNPVELINIIKNLDYKNEENKYIEWYKKDSIIEIKYFEKEKDVISYVEFYMNGVKPEFYAWNFIRPGLLEKIN